MFKESPSLTREQKALIIGFMAGSRGEDSLSRFDKGAQKGGVGGGGDSSPSPSLSQSLLTITKTTWSNKNSLLKQLTLTVSVPLVGLHEHIVFDFYPIILFSDS